MENQRGILIFAFAVASYFMFLAWQDDYSSVAVVEESTKIQATEETPTIETVVEGAVPQASLEEDQALKQSPETEIPVSARLITITTDVLRVKIDPRGGDVVSSELLLFPLVKGKPEKPVSLMKKGNGRTYLAESGLIGKTTPDGTANKALFVSEKENYTLQAGEEIIDLPLTWVNEAGVVFTKTWRMRKGDYSLDLDYQVNNASKEKINTRLYTQLTRDQLEVETTQEGLGMKAYLGTAFSTDEDVYEKYDFEDIVDKKLDIKTQGGWVAILQHYFVSAWVPPADQGNNIYSLVIGEKVAIGTFQPTVSVSPGSKHNFKARLYMGPKNQEELKKIADGLDLTVDYGVLWWIGQPIFWLLKFMYSVVGNWGFSIILVTFVVKLLLYPLSNKQYRSFGKMRKLQPKMQALKERYGDDRQKMGQETMKLYKKEGVNPLGGCLPLLVQMPVFFALYWVLMESVEIRQAPFILWIDDLSVKDPFFILPLVMGASMWLMQKMQPTAANMDPMQQKIMQFMPVMMTVFFFFFPAGLVLYWVVNNLLSISQQTFVTKMMEREDNLKTSKK